MNKVTKKLYLTAQNLYLCQKRNQNNEYKNMEQQHTITPNKVVAYQQ